MLLRRALNDHHDVLVAFASRKPVGDDPYRGDRWWGKDDWVGVFVQERDRTSSIRAIALVAAKSDEEGVIRVKRATGDELLLARIPEKGGALDNVELLFDAPSGKLIREVRYPPFAVRRVVEQQGVPRFLATNQKDFFAIEPVSSDEYFRIARNGSFPNANNEFHPVRFGPNGRFTLEQESGGFFGKALVIVESAAGKTARFAIPQSTVDQYARARPAAIRNGWRPGADSIQEEIGPFQLADGQLWFGKTFYDSEGMSGIGGFGYFDTKTRNYRLYSPPDLRDWSVSAMLVETDAVWISLFHRGEYGDSGGGVIRFDRTTQEARKFVLGSIVHAMTRYQGRLYFGTSDGVAFLDSGRIREFLVDYDKNGAPRLVEPTQ